MQATTEALWGGERGTCCHIAHSKTFSVVKTLSLSDPFFPLSKFLRSTTSPVLTLVLLHPSPSLSGLQAIC